MTFEEWWVANRPHTENHKGVAEKAWHEAEARVAREIFAALEQEYFILHTDSLESRQQAWESFKAKYDKASKGGDSK